jgi:hypothetical protein
MRGFEHNTLVLKHAIHPAETGERSRSCFTEVPCVFLQVMNIQAFPLPYLLNRHLYFKRTSFISCTEEVKGQALLICV